MMNTKETYRYLYKRDKPFMLKVLGFVVAIIALFKIADTPVFSIIMVMGSTGIFAYQTGIEFNFAKRLYREINAFGPQSFGEWKDLPPIEYISVFQVNLVSAVYGRSGASVSTKKKVYQVNLITNKNRRLRLLETENIDEAFQFAKEYAAYLDLKIWDASTKEAKWLNS